MNLETLTNEELADEFLKHFWDNYKKRLERLSFLRNKMQIFGDDEKLEDMFHETVAKCAEKIRKDGFGKETEDQYTPGKGHYKEKKKSYYFGAYFDTALYYNLVQYDLDQKRRAQKRSHYVATETAPHIEPEDYELPGVPSEQQRQLQWLEEAVLLLRETNRLAYNLQRSGLTYKRISRKLGISQDAVKMRLITAKKLIKSYMIDKQHEYDNPIGEAK